MAKIVNLKNDVRINKKYVRQSPKMLGKKLENLKISRTDFFDMMPKLIKKTICLTLCEDTIFYPNMPNAP